MNVERLLERVLQDPDSDEPRLAYADMLEHAAPDTDADRNRPAFIRTQIAIARTGIMTSQEEWDRFQTLQATSADLFRQHGHRWQQPLTELGAEECAFHRGFVHHIAMRRQAFLRRAEEVFRTSPIDSLALRDVDGRIEEVLSLQVLSRLKALFLENAGLSEDQVIAIAECPHLQNLKELDVRGNDVGARGAGALASPALMPNLGSLHMEYADIGEEGVDILRGSFRNKLSCTGYEESKPRLSLLMRILRRVFQPRSGPF
ncbi:MAG: hypothetical protein Greene041619_95 [Candidatus Peregrinibacteria bacterium Greene0416_19]|nr:MAG: hypothetical protein Greene041619_95 [Candidatus Peregrinibacteria bacterium Greene0416_19]